MTDVLEANIIVTWTRQHKNIQVKKKSNWVNSPETIIWKNDWGFRNLRAKEPGPRCSVSSGMIQAVVTPGVVERSWAMAWTGAGDGVHTHGNTKGSIIFRHVILSLECEYC